MPNSLKNIFLLFCGLVASSCLLGQQKPVYYVDPFIGTSNDANTYPGASVPWGMIAVNPFNVDLKKHPNSATSYKNKEPFIYGFSHTRLSGVGCPDMGSIMLMPSQGKQTYIKDSLQTAYANEKATAGYYAVDLLKNNIRAEMSATERTAISRYQFLNAGNKFISLDLSESLSRQRGAFVRKISANEIEGYKTDGGFCGRPVAHKVFFYLIIREKVTVQLWDKEKDVVSDSSSGDGVGAFVLLRANSENTLTVKIGISYVSMASAKLNLQAEQPGWNFEAVKARAGADWNRELSKIKVQGNSVDDKKIFYTGIYHILQHPNIINDVNGEYPAMNSHAPKKSNRNHYSTFSLWDTYRNVHPFLTLVYPERQSDMVASMIDMYKESGWLPKWELAANETHVMVGDPASVVITDTYLKGVKDFDVAAAYKAMLHNAAISRPGNPLRPGLKQYLHYGYIPNDDKEDVWGSVATTLEYCFSDWNLAQMAKQLSKKSDYETFKNRSQLYKNLFDSTTRFMRPKLKDRQWLQPFDPITINGEQGWNNSGAPGFVEGSSWQYSWFVPHDIPGLKALMGGDVSFTRQLQKAFDSSYFVLWNEPDMAYPYLFNYVKGEEWRTQKTVLENVKKHFDTTTDGIPGNDDCGTLSAWLVFSMIGFYPDCPGSVQYAVTTPSFNRIAISLNQDYYKGRKFVINKKGKTNRIDYVQLNKKVKQSFFIDHHSITNGGTLNIITHNNDTGSEKNAMVDLRK